MTTALSRPEAQHIGVDDLPFVDIGGGNMLKVLQVRESEGLWIIENIFQKGFEVDLDRLSLLISDAPAHKVESGSGYLSNETQRRIIFALTLF